MRVERPSQKRCAEDKSNGRWVEAKASWHDNYWPAFGQSILRYMRVRFSATLSQTAAVMKERYENEQSS